MGFPTAILNKVRSVLGVPTIEPPHGYGPEFESKPVQDAARAIGGTVQQIPYTQLRWYLQDLEYAQAGADAGNLTMYGQMWRAMRRDGDLYGLLQARTASAVRTPRRFFGKNADILAALQSMNGTRSVYEEMIPPSEASAMIADGVGPGVSVGLLLPVVGRTYPVLVRLDPEWLMFRWAESRWYYQSRVGLLPIYPGNGTWVLHCPGGRVAPWQWGNLPALGRAFIMKEHAVSLRGAMIAGVANPAKYLKSPNGAVEQHKRSLFQHLLQWGPNTAVELPTGWDMGLLEMKGQAYQIFQQEIDTCNKTYMRTVAGQEVTTTGGVGFGNVEVPATIRKDLTSGDLDSWYYTVNTQILPQYVAANYGDAEIDAGTGVAAVTNTAKDLEAVARTLSSLGPALVALKTSFPDVNVRELLVRMGVPLIGDPATETEETTLNLAKPEGEPDGDEEIEKGGED